MGIFDFLNRHESLVALDIGSSSVKLIELDTTQEKPRLVNLGLSPLATDVFSNNLISKLEDVSENVTVLLETNGIEHKRIVTAMPGPSVFTKKIKMPKVDYAELANNIQFEAGNFIPHNIDAVRLDFHVLGETGKQLEVLVVAVKNEIIDSFVESLALAGLEAAVVDVDYFALQNVFEMSYPEYIDQTVALINMGARFSSINICRSGDSLFTGDISVGGNVFTEAIEAETGLAFAQAEKLKLENNPESEHAEAVREAIDRSIETVASEFNRQLSFFWNASGSDEGIDRIMLTGGGSMIPGLIAELSEKTGIACEAMDPFRGIDCDESIDQSYLKEVGPLMSIGVGLGIRQPGDKIIPDYD